MTNVLEAPSEISIHDLLRRRRSTRAHSSDPEAVLAKEQTPRTRKPLSEIVFRGAWGK